MKKIMFFVCILIACYYGNTISAQDLLTPITSENKVALNIDYEQSGIIHLSKTLFDEIMDWSGKKDQEVPLDAFLKAKNNFDQVEIDRFLSSHFGGSPAKTDNHANGSGDCHCSVMSVTPAHEMTPPNLSTTSFGNSYSQGLLGNWEYDVTKQRHGAANRHALVAHGGHMGGEYEATTSGTLNSSTSIAKFLLGYLCTSDGNLPSFCGCEKAVDLTARYESELAVYNSVGGPWSKGSYAKVEESAVLFTYAKNYDGNTNNEVETAEVLSTTNALLSRNTVSTWNPQFWLNVLDLAETALGVILLENDVDADVLSTLNDQIGNLITTSFYLNYGSQGNGAAQNTMAMHYDGAVTLEPNTVRHIAMVSNGAVYGRGYGGSWAAAAAKSSNFFISLVIPFNDSEPNCCIEKTGRWMMAATPYSPNTLSTMQNSVAPIMTVFGPWVNLSDNDFNGNVDITMPIGIAISNPQCPDCSTMLNPPYLTPAGPLVAGCPMESFDLTAVGQSADLYHFERNGTLYQSSTSPTVTATQSGYYRVYLELDGCTSPLSDPVSITIPTLNKPSLTIEEGLLCEGITATLQLNVDVLPGGSSYYNNIQWIGPNINQTGTDYIVEIQESGYYGVTLYTDCGIVSSAIVYFEFEDCSCSPGNPVTGLSASNNIFANSVDLHWDPVTDIIDYRVYIVRTNPNGPVTVFNNYVPENQLIDFPIQIGAQYYYQVRARCIGGAFSPWSEQHFFGITVHDGEREKYSAFEVTDHAWTAYPNPTEGVVHLSIDEIPVLPHQMELLDISGRKVMQQELAGNMTIEIGHLPSGLYMIKIVTDEGQFQVLKVVKR